MLKILILLSITILQIGCREKGDMSTINSQLSSNSCLEGINLSKLEIALDNCNKIIEKYPNSALALNARSMLFILLDEDDLACKDIEKGISLIKNKTITNDRLLIHELKTRHKNCIQSRTISDND